MAASNEPDPFRVIRFNWCVCPETRKMINSIDSKRSKSTGTVL